jgi:predicted site-specific integrase-resolvase
MRQIETGLKRMEYSLKSASEATGKSKSTIQRAIKTGKISATLNNFGTYQIDPSELHRIFPPVSSGVSIRQTATEDVSSENRELKAKVSLLREMVDDLRHRLDLEAEERRRLTLLLTQEEKKISGQMVRPVFLVALFAVILMAFFLNLSMYFLN